MRFILLITFFCISFSVSATEKSVLDSVSQLQWSDRVLLIFGDKDYRLQLNAQLDGINTRHIKWFLFNKEEVLSNHTHGVSKEFSNEVMSRYFVEGVAVVLIGKDGGVKSRQAELDLSLIFETIDSMPMRLQEMQQQENKR